MTLAWHMTEWSSDTIRRREKPILGLLTKYQPKRQVEDVMERFADRHDTLPFGVSTISFVFVFQEGSHEECCLVKSLSMRVISGTPNVK